MAGNCSSPQQKQVPQFCDIFKTMSVESTVGISNGQHAKSVLTFDFLGLHEITTHASQGYIVSYRWEHQPRQQPQDRLLTLTVLRI